MKKIFIFTLFLFITGKSFSQNYLIIDDYTVINPSAPGNCDGAIIINSLPSGVTNHVVYYQAYSNGIGQFYSPSDTITGLCEDFYVLMVSDQNNHSNFTTVYLETSSGNPYGYVIDSMIINPETSVGACDGNILISSNGTAIGGMVNVTDPLTSTGYWNATISADPETANGLCMPPLDELNVDYDGLQVIFNNNQFTSCYACILTHTLSNLQHSNTFASCDGSVTLQAFGGIPPYTYDVSNGSSIVDSTSPVIVAGLCPGNYTYDITDDAGNTTSGNFTINDLGITPDTAELMTVYYRVINPINPGDCNGALVVDSIVNGTPPYYFHLNKGNDPLWFVLPGAAAYNLCDWGYVFEVYDSNCDHVFITAQPDDATSQYYTRSFQLGLTNESTDGGCDGELDLKFFPNLYNGNMTISNYLGNQIYFNGGQVTNPATYSNICMNQSEGIHINLNPNYFDSYRAVNDFALDGFGQFCEPFVVEKNITPVTALGNCDGEIDLNIFGGHPPYTFEYSNGSTVEDLTGLCAGYYTVEFNDTYWNYKATSFIITDSAHLYENDLTFIPSDTLYSNTIENCDFDYSLPIDTVYLDTTYSTGPNLITTEYIIVQGSNEFIFTESFQYDSLLNYMVIFDFYCTTRSVDGYYSVHTGLPLLNIFNGIDESSANNEIQNLEVYPNPFNSLLNIDFLAKESLEIEVEVYDISGRIIYRENYNSQDGKNSYLLNLNNISNGIYFVKITADDLVLGAEKIIKY